MGALVSILQAGNLLVSFIVPALETALKIKSFFSLDSSYTVNVTNLSGDAITADDATISAINAWRAGVGLPPLELAPAPPAPAAPVAPGDAPATPVVVPTAPPADPAA